MRTTEQSSPLALVNDLAAGVAAWGVPGTDPERPIDVPDGVWAALLSRLAMERISGLAVAASTAGTLRVDGQRRDALLSLHRDAMAWCLTIERTLLRAARWLDDARVPFVVLKGPSLAHTLYPDPTWRAFGDLDLLVQASDWRRACAVFEGRGYPRELPQPRIGFDERFGKAAVYTVEAGVQIDLHRTLVLGPFGLWMDPAELFQRTTTFALGGRELQRLDDTAMLLSVASHAALGWSPPRLVPLRDVVQVAQSCAVDWELLADWAVRWRTGVVLGFAFAEASRTLGAAIPPSARPLLEREPDRGERRALEAYTTDRKHRGGAALTTVRAIPGMRAKAAYVRALVLPDRMFLEARARQMGERGSYVRRMKVALRWITGRRGAA